MEQNDTNNRSKRIKKKLIVIAAIATFCAAASITIIHPPIL